MWRVPSEWIIPSGMTSNRLRPRWISTYASRQSSAVFEPHLYKVTLRPVRRTVFFLKRYVFHGEALD